MKKLRSLFAGAVLALAAGAAIAANIPNTPTPTDPSQIVFLFNQLIQNINTLITPQSIAPLASTRNYLDNGEQIVQQRGTGNVTCGTTSGPGVTAYGPDRWACDVNVTSGAGQMNIVTSSPTPPPGFTASTKLVRISGSLAQPVCTEQEIPTERATDLQGQLVVFSTYLQALAGLSADNGNTANLIVISGTGSDQGLGALRGAVGMTASPALTPVWTGLATLVNTPITLSTLWSKYQTVPVLVPQTATELVVMICFTPTTTSTGGATDGLAFVGGQFEPIAATALPAGQVASIFEFHPSHYDIGQAQRFYWQFSEAAGALATPGGQCQATNTPKVVVQLPEPMAATPVAAWTVGGWLISIAGAAATAPTGGAGASLALATTLGEINLSFTNTCTAGTTISPLVGVGTTGLLTVSADF